MLILIWLNTALLLAIFSMFAGTTPAAVWLGFVCTATTVYLAWSMKSHSLGTIMAAVFFSLCAAHVTLGYLGATPLLAEINGSSRIGPMVRESYLVVSAGLFFTLLGYKWKSPVPGATLLWLTSRAENRDPSSILAFTKISKGFLIAGCCLIAYVVFTAGYFPILAANPGAARYLTTLVDPGFAKYEWVLDKGLNLLNCSVPFVMYTAVERRKAVDSMLAVAGFVALSIPLRRANIVSCLVLLALMCIIRHGRISKKYIFAAGTIVVGYLFLQVVFLQGINANGQRQTSEILLTGFPEVRDLGWMIDSIREERFIGKTLVAAINPLPTIMSADKEKYGLGFVTIRLGGLDIGGATGGLRITWAGEWYLNFGMLGVAAGCFLLGICLKWTTLFLDLSKLLRHEVLLYLALQTFLWLGMWVYLAGTEAIGVIRNGILLLLCSWYLATRKRMVSALR